MRGEEENTHFTVWTPGACGVQGLAAEGSPNHTPIERKR